MAQPWTTRRFEFGSDADVGIAVIVTGIEPMVNGLDTVGRLRETYGMAEVFIVRHTR